MNNEKVGLGGWLTMYITVLVIGIITSLPRLLSDNSAVILLSVVFLILNVTCLVLILKRSPHAILSNKILLGIELLSSVYLLFKLSSLVPGIDSSEVAKSMGQGMGIASILFYSTLLLYWSVSKRVKNTFSKTLVSPTDSTVSSAQGVSASTALQRSFFIILVLASNGAMIFTGWGIFLLPVTFGISLVYVVSMLAAFRKWQTPGFISSCLGLAVSLGFVSYVLNAGIATDGPSLSYLVPSIMGVPSETLEPFFKTLLALSFSYLVFLGIGSVMLAKKASKSIAILIVVLSISLIALHVGRVMLAAPELKIQVEAAKILEQEKESARIESQYTFNATNVAEKALIKRVYSIFTPPVIKAAKADQCPYGTALAMALVGTNLKQEMQYDCLYDMVKPLYTLPHTSQKPVGVTISNKTKWLKKGDVLVYTVKLSPGTYVWVNAKGNAAKDCSCRMSPFDYRGVVESTVISTSTRVYEYSVVQHVVSDKERIVTVMYPINVDGVKDIELRLSQFSDNPESEVTLIEVAYMKPKFIAPAWLKEWSQEPNPFL